MLIGHPHRYMDVTKPNTTSGNISFIFHYTVLNLHKQPQTTNVATALDNKHKTIVYA